MTKIIYNTRMHCPKCGAHVDDPIYCTKSPSRKNLCIEGEHMHIRCFSCKYQFVVRPIDWTYLGGERWRAPDGIEYEDST